MSKIIKDINGKDQEIKDDAKLDGIIFREGTIFGDVNLRRANLKKTVLKNCAFYNNENYQGAHLEGAHLEGATLEHTHLNGTHLIRAHLEGAHLEGAYLQHAHLEGAYLEGAYLEGAHLQGANLQGAKINSNTNTNFSNNNIFKGAQLQKANLNDVIFSNDIDLPGFKFVNTQLKDAKFERAILIRADFTDADFTTDDLRDTDYEADDFALPDFKKTVFTEAKLQGAIFNGVEIENAKFESAKLQDAKFIEADLKGANFNDANLERANFNGANLENAQFIGANLQGADFSTLISLEEADFNGANLDGATMRRRDLRLARNVNENGLRIIAPPVQRPRPIQRQGQELEDEEPTPVQNALNEGVDIHIVFRLLDIDTIIEFMSDFNRSHQINTKTVFQPQPQAKKSMFQKILPRQQSQPQPQPQPQTLFTPLLNFINNSELFKPNEKENYKEQTNRVLHLAEQYSGFISNEDFLMLIIKFVSKQSDYFIDQYIRALRTDCLKTYSERGNNTESCIKGIFERIFTVLGDTATILITDEENLKNLTDETKEICETLQFFFQIYTEVIKKWNTLYLNDDGEKHGEIVNLTALELKDHFINFMITEYGGHPIRAVMEKINEDTQTFETGGVFERRSFGGNNKKRKTRKGKKGRKGRKTRKERKGRKTKRRK